MLKTSLTLPALSLIAIGISPSGYANECQGELYGINAGRGDLGLLFSLNEEAQTAQANSVAKFSSSALAFDSATNRMYYVASPRPTEYEVDISGLTISADELAHLPIKEKNIERPNSPTMTSRAKVIPPWEQLSPSLGWFMIVKMTFYSLIVTISCIKLTRRLAKQPSLLHLAVYRANTAAT